MLDAGVDACSLASFVSCNAISRLEMYVRSEQDESSYGVSAAALPRLAEAVGAGGLSELCLYGNLSVEGMRAMGEAARKSKELNSLTLYASEIGGDGAAAIADALSHDCSLVSLDLKCERGGWVCDRPSTCSASSDIQEGERT